MPRITLTLSEIDELITAYKSSLKKLRFQLETTTETLRELQGLREAKKQKMMGQLVKEKKEEPSDTLPDQPKAARKSAVKKPKRRKKTPRAEGYRLSEWDNTIIDVIRNNQKPMSSGDLINAVIANEAMKGAQHDEVFVKGKVARSLQKLVNKRGTLRKHATRGKGFAYGLGEWFFAKTGKLKKAFQ